jgi:hypothetical protein
VGQLPLGQDRLDGRAIRRRASDVPKRIKGDYATEELTSYQIDTLAEQSAAVCLVHVTLTINDEVFHPALRWVYQNEGGQVQVPGLDEGSWRLMCWGAPWMKRDVAADDAEPSA